MQIFFKGLKNFVLGTNFCWAAFWLTVSWSSLSGLLWGSSSQFLLKRAYYQIMSCCSIIAILSLLFVAYGVKPRPYLLGLYKVLKSYLKMFETLWYNLKEFHFWNKGHIWLYGFNNILQYTQHTRRPWKFYFSIYSTIWKQCFYSYMYTLRSLINVQSLITVQGVTLFYKKFKLSTGLALFSFLRP